MVTSNPARWVEVLAVLALAGTSVWLWLYRGSIMWSLVAATLATAFFVAIHLAIELVAICRYLRREVRDCVRRRPSANTANQTIETLGTELQKRPVDAQAPHRDVAKQCVTTAGVVLGIIVAFPAQELSFDIVLAGSSLAAAIGTGLLLLERVSGKAQTNFELNTNAILYSLMWWTLLFGVVLLALALWQFFLHPDQTQDTVGKMFLV